MQFLVLTMTIYTYIMLVVQVNSTKRFVILWPFKKGFLALLTLESSALLPWGKTALLPWGNTALLPGGVKCPVSEGKNALLLSKTHCQILLEFSAWLPRGHQLGILEDFTVWLPRRGLQLGSPRRGFQLGFSRRGLLSLAFQEEPPSSGTQTLLVRAGCVRPAV